MATANTNKKNRVRKILIIGAILLAAAVGTAWYIFTDSFSDTAKEKAAYTFNALDFIKEFQQNDSASNKKYAEQIITINGRVTEIEQADTTVNIKMADTTNGSYVIFAFQQQDIANVKKIKQGDSVSIKGSCSGGVYSDILETEFITFKRCSIN
jgi:RecJ-like exonuclease